MPKVCAQIAACPIWVFRSALGQQFSLLLPKQLCVRGLGASRASNKERFLTFCSNQSYGKLLSLAAQIMETPLFVSRLSSLFVKTLCQDLCCFLKCLCLGCVQEENQALGVLAISVARGQCSTQTFQNNFPQSIASNQQFQARQ